MAQKSAVETLIVRIEAPEMDKRVLLEKLNQHGSSHGLSFQQSEEGYQYRIVFGTEQQKAQVLYLGSGGTYNTSAASAIVYDPKGLELFHFSRANRASDKGATNTTAKEIIKRLVDWRKEQHKGS